MPPAKAVCAVGHASILARLVGLDELLIGLHLLDAKEPPRLRAPGRVGIARRLGRRRRLVASVATAALDRLEAARQLGREELIKHTPPPLHVWLGIGPGIRLGGRSLIDDGLAAAGPDRLQPNESHQSRDASGG